MTADREWIVIPDWGQLQHYKKRRPTWLKLYVSLNSDDRYLSLSGHVTRPLRQLRFGSARTRLRRL